MIDIYMIREVRSLVNVIVLFPKQEVARSIRNLLVRSGFEVTAVCATGAQVVQRMEGVEEGLVVCGYKCSDMIYSELREYLSEEVKMLLIASRQYLDDCVYPNVIGLSMPLKGYELVEKRERSLPKFLRSKDEENNVQNNVREKKSVFWKKSKNY